MTALNQRWLQGRSTFRPAEPIRTSEYDVVELESEATAKAFVTAHHYSRTFPAARFRIGLYRRGVLVGVAVFSVPANARALTNVFGAAPAVELGRFVLLDEVPGNGETWFLGRAFAALRGRVSGVLSCSDPVPRTCVDGRTVFPGHVGTIYQAHNARFIGPGTASTLRLLPDGRVFSRRAEQKIRGGERGHAYAVEQLVEAGAARPDLGADLREWLREWLPRVTRPLKHPGNLRYAWRLDRGALPAGLPYPKRAALALGVAA